MGLTGSLRTLSLAEIAQTLCRSRANGVLELSSPDGGREVYFIEGQIARIVETDTPVQHTLLERLSALGLVNDPQALAHNAGTSGGFTTIQHLIEHGVLDAGAVQEAVDRLTTDQFLDLMTWENASFVFVEANDDTPDLIATLREIGQQRTRLPLDMLLMESARRLDEWERIRNQLPSDESIISPAEGRAEELQSRCGYYPASSVLPLIDGLYSIGEIVDRAPCTRVDVYTVLHGLLASGVIVVLSIDDMISVGNALMSGGDYARAAGVYRRIVSFDPGREEVKQNLAGCLEAMGDAPEAASSYGQLAIASLEKGAAESAVLLARRAVALQPENTQQLILVRCLLAANDIDGAVTELVRLARRFTEDGKIEEARSTCLKALQIKRDDPEVRRHLSLLQQQAGEGGEGDAIVCVECGESNPRARDTCRQCGGSLHLACLFCGRVVGVSDHICIFCGNSPHVNPEECRSRAVHGPATTAIISHMRLGGEGAMGDMTRSALAESVRAARECERNGDYAEALIRWKSLLHDQGENPRLQKHIRNLEALAHDQAVERLIARGHALRERRAFLRAISCYRSAIRGMANEDPRASRLHKVVTATRKHARLTAVIYSAAGLILLVVAYLVAEPWLELSHYRGAISEARVAVQRAPTAKDPVAAFEQIHQLISSEKLQPSTVELKSRAELAYRDLLQLYNTSVGELARKEARAIRRAHQQQRWGEVVERKARFDEVFAIHAPQPGLRELGEEATARLELEVARSERLEQDPQRLARAQELIAQGDYPAALPILESLAQSPDEATRSAARSAREQLAQQAAAIERRVAELEAVIEQDLAAAAARLTQLRETAAGWGREPELDALAERIAAGREAAQLAWRALGDRPDAAQLRAFLAEYGASPEAAPARARLAELDKARDQQRNALAQYRAAVDRQDPAAAFEAARAYLLRYPDRAASDAIKLPLLLDAGMSDVALMADGEQVAKTDAQGTALWWYAPERTAQLTAVKPGFEPTTTSLARLRNQWRWPVEPVRAPVWQLAIGGQIEAMTGLPGGTLVVADAREAIAIDQGRELWRRSLGDGMMLTSGSDSRTDPVAALDDTRLLLPLKQGGIRILDRQSGRVLASQELSDPVRGMPVLYTSALRQGEQRIACIADGLRFGRLGQDLRVAQMRSTAQSGPLALRGDLEVLLVVATSSGLTAVEDSTGAVRWRFDLDATNVGPLVQLDDAHLLTVLDGSRLVCCRIASQGATRSWQQVLSGESLIGHPQIAAGRVYLTTDRRLLVFDATGSRDPQRSIEAPGRWTCPVAVRQELAVCATAGAQDSVGDQLHVYRSGEMLWSRQLPGRVRRVAFAGPTVIVGLAGGRLLAFEP